MPVIEARWTTGTRAASRLAALVVDAAMANEVLRVVQPAAIEAAVVASEDARVSRTRSLQAWTRDLEAARYAAQRAQKQYDATDPENRLVADELERRWNQALQRVHEIEAPHRSARPGSPTRVAAPTREEFAGSGGGPGGRVAWSARPMSG